MPITNPNAKLVTEQDLVPGDILIMYDDDEGGPYHAMMWIGGNKPIAHSSNSGSTSGTVAQGSNKFLKISSAEPMFEVYRSVNPQLALRAAELAGTACLLANAATYVAAKRLAEEYAANNKQIRISLKTAYSQHHSDDGGIWNNECGLRAIRAYYRAVSRKPLSRTGVSCSQFVSYIYQAAAVDLMTRVMPQARVLIQEAIDRKLLDNLNSAPGCAASLALLKKPCDALTVRFSKTLKVNAKITSIDRLTKDLIADPAFNLVGNIAPFGRADNSVSAAGITFPTPSASAAATAANPYNSASAAAAAAAKTSAAAPPPPPPSPNFNRHSGFQYQPSSRAPSKK